MGAVLHFKPASTVDEAWERYARVPRQMEDNPKLLSDRQFQEDMARAHKHWRTLFLAEEREP
jgi:hypothetical protein